MTWLTRKATFVISAVIVVVSLPVIGVLSWQTYRWTVCREAGARVAEQAQSTGLGITPVVEYDPFDGCTTTVLGTKVKLDR